MDITVFTEVVHARCYALQHGHQLRRYQLVLPFLQQVSGRIRAWAEDGVGLGCSFLTQDPLPEFLLTLRKASRAPFSMNSVMIMMGFPETQARGQVTMNTRWPQAAPP